MTEQITSLFDNIKQKTTNPFFGTLILVWAYRNWELLYTLFNFDNECTLDDKKVFIISYFNGREPFWVEFWVNVAYALLFVVLGIFFTFITRFVLDLVNNNFKPWAYKVSINNSVVRREQYDETNQNLLNSLAEIETTKSLNTRLAADNRKLEEENGRFIIKIDSEEKRFKQEIDRLGELLKSGNEIHELYKEQQKDLKLKNDLLEGSNKIVGYTKNALEQFISSYDSNIQESEIDSIYIKLKENKYFKNYIQFSNVILYQYESEFALDYNMSLFYEKLGLINRIHMVDEYKTMNTYLTSKGIRLRDCIMNIESKN